MAVPPVLQRPPSAEALARLCAVLAPGSRPARVRRLPGGLDAGMHTLDLIADGETLQRLVLRRFPEHLLAQDPLLPPRHWQTLGLLGHLGIASPRPVFFDADGSLLGLPAVVMTRLPGRSRLPLPLPASWIDQLATALARLHRSSLADLDHGLLPRPAEQLQHECDRLLAMQHEHPDHAQMAAAVRRWRGRLRPVVPALVHGDYWIGNTLWLRGRLTGIVDWDSAALAAPGLDVGYCRADLSMLAGPDVPDRFLNAYEAAAGRRIPQLAFWDLLGAARALPDPAVWLPGLHDLGATQIDATLMRNRHRAFIANALERAG